MKPQILDLVLLLSGLSAALVAGVFLTFSDFLMRALGASAPAAGTEAMQHVNREVFTSVFMVLLLGSVVVALALFGISFGPVPAPASGWMRAGALTYVFGVFTVTGLGNVPMNKRLDGMDHLSDAGQAYWRIYNSRWTRLNHVRTLCAALAAAFYLTAAMA